MSRFEKSAIRGPYRVGVFVDSLNIYCACRDRWSRVVDHGRLMQTALAGHRLQRAIIYVVRFSDKMDQWIKAVERYGFEVKEKDPVPHQDGHAKANWDTDIVVDVLRLLDEFDMVVLATGDGDFCALVQRCQELGKVVRVIGVEGSTNKCLKELADEFIPVTEDMLLAERLQQKPFGKSLGEAFKAAKVGGAKE